MYKRITMSLVIILLIVCFNCNVGLGREVESKFRITIDIPSRVLTLYEGSSIIKEYPVAVGKSISQTPTGNYRVINKAVNPYYKKGDIPGGSPYNPLGERWIGFKIHYGIHGNSNPDSIGTFASGGCVRMYERDVKELYEIVDISVPVDVKYDLIKTYYDINKENPVLLIYPDYYFKEKDLDIKVEEKLKELGIFDKVDPDRLKKLKERMKREEVIISEGKTLFINGRYVTKDIIINNNYPYINKDMIGKFFNIDILEINGESKVSFLDRKIETINLNEKIYISLNEIQGILGGSISIDDEQELVNYNVNYVTLNNVLVEGKAEDLREDPIIPILPIYKELNIVMNSHDNNLEFQYEGLKMNTVLLNNQHYISVASLANTISSTMDIFTLNRRINIAVDPTIVYSDVIYKGKLQDNEILIPYEIITKEFVTNVEGDELRPLTPAFVGLQSLEVRYISNKAYIKLKDIEDIMENSKNIYNTKIYLKRRSI